MLEGVKYVARTCINYVVCKTCGSRTEKCSKDGESSTCPVVKRVGGNNGSCLSLSKPLFSRDLRMVAHMLRMLCVFDSDILQGIYDRALVLSSWIRKPRKTINVYGRW